MHRASSPGFVRLCGASLAFVFATGSASFAKAEDTGGCGARAFLLDTVLKSICGRPTGEWTPLQGLADGWLDPWVPPRGAGSSGAPRQGWINSFDGHFTREGHLVYSFTNETADGRDAHLGLTQIQTPLSRRLWIGVDLPFVTALESDRGLPSEAGFGDMSITPGVMLYEREDVSLSGRLGIRVPTGDEQDGGGQTQFFPRLEFWSDLGDAWTLRGGAGVDVPTHARRGPDAVFVTNLAVGRTFTPHEATPFGDFAGYLALTMRNDMGADENHTFLSLTPGIRTHVGRGFFLLAGLEVPVVGPRPFEQRATFAIVRGF